MNIHIAGLEKQTSDARTRTVVGVIDNWRLVSIVFYLMRKQSFVMYSTTTIIHNSPTVGPLISITILLLILNIYESITTGS